MVKADQAWEKWFVLYYQKGMTWINGKPLAEKKDAEEHPSEEVESSRIVYNPRIAQECWKILRKEMRASVFYFVGSYVFLLGWVGGVLGFFEWSDKDITRMSLDFTGVPLKLDF